MPRRPVLIAGIAAITGAAVITVAALTTAVSHGSPARPASAVADAPSSKPSGSASPAAGAPATARPAPTAATPAPAPASSATTVPPRSVTTAPRRAATPSAGASAPAGSPTAASTGPQPAAPGTYHYRQVGSLPGTPSQGTLVVSPASASGTQTWTRAVGGTVAPSSSVMRFTNAGAFLVSPGNQASGGAASCSFAAPVAWPPWPTTPGARTSGRASCTGGITSYNVSGVVQGTATDTLDGHTITTSVVVYAITLAGNVNGTALNVTLTETDHYSPTLRVPVITQTHLAGTALGLAVTTDRTDTLLSATPS